MDNTQSEMVNQLMAFGYTTEDCITALSKTKNHHDINNIVTILNEMDYNELNSNIVQSTKKHASHNNLIVFGYSRQIYESKYNKSIPSDIKLLCCDYYGYGLCCIAFTKREFTIQNGDFKPEDIENFYISNKLSYTLNYKHNNINSIESLFTSIIAKHMTCFKYLYNIHIDVKLNGDPTLFISAKTGNIDCVNYLLQLNTILLDETNASGRTPLFIASFFGYYKIVKILLSHSNKMKKLNICNGIIDINKSDRKGFTPLFVASQNGHLDIVRLLLQNNANINKYEERQHTPLWIASLRGNIEIVIILLCESNIEIDFQDLSGVSALWAACKQNNIEIVKLLLNPKSNIYNFKTKSANPNLSKIDGCSPLWISASEGHSQCVELLIQYGANVNQANTSQNATPLFVACQNGQNNCVKILINANADVNIPRCDGTSPIMMAAHNGHIDVVNTLIKGGANALHLNVTCLNAIGCTAMNGHYEILIILYKYLLNIKNENEISELCNKGDNVNGWTPLMLACMGGHENTIKYLIEIMNVDICKKDFENKKAFQHAWENGYQSVSAWLLQLEKKLLCL